MKFEEAVSLYKQFESRKVLNLLAKWLCLTVLIHHCALLPIFILSLPIFNAPFFNTTQITTTNTNNSKIIFFCVKKNNCNMQHVFHATHPVF